ncbi:hypothetical protein LIER_11814 [Lithospermum erythrorhizon]|uniref:Integrase catalytic domain-containing protein n=1 Tax=Lithospermum erythrorhizon TaxID=34254 RepID=A0AAV3PR29_LITER
MNKQADALAGLASSLTSQGVEIKVLVCEKWVILPLFEAQEYEEGEEEAESMAITTTSGALFRKSFGKILLRYLSDTEVAQAMNEAHSEVSKDYFSKWAEVVPLLSGRKEEVADFIKSNIIYRYGVPRNITHPYYPQANGLAKPFNKTLCNIPKKVVNKSKKNWHEEIEEALWAYKTTHRMRTQATPYALVYGVEAVLLLEVKIPSLRVAVKEGFTQEEAMQLKLQELDSVDEQNLQAHQRLECYQSRISKAYNKKVGPINGLYLKKYYP